MRFRPLYAASTLRLPRAGTVISTGRTRLSTKCRLRPTRMTPPATLAANTKANKIAVSHTFRCGTGGAEATGVDWGPASEPSVGDDPGLVIGMAGPVVSFAE